MRCGAAFLLGALCLALPARPAAGQATPPVIPPVPPGATPPSPAPEAPSRGALHELVSQPGVVIVTRRRELPAIPLEHGQLVVSGVGAFEPGREAERLFGVRLDLQAEKLSPRRQVFYLDLHEVEKLLRALALLEQVADDPRPGLVTEADYELLEGLSVGIRSETQRRHYFLRTRGEESPEISLPAASFTRLREQLQQARRSLFD